MEMLTKEQLQRIEENRKAAERKREQQISLSIPSTNHTGTHQNAVRNPAIVNANSKTFPSKALGKPVKNVLVSSSANSGVCHLISDTIFSVKMGFNEQVIEVFKSISGRVFDNSTKEWNFPLTEHGKLISKVASVLPKFSLEPLPRAVLCAFATPEPDVNVDLTKIDQVLLRSLLPFQVEGVKFGVSRKGRCLIADDMGLGKTIQALGIGHYYIDKWPMLIVCPSSMRFPWEEAIHTFLPSVNPFHVVVITTANDVIHDATIVITSYDLLKSCLDAFKKKRFGVIIFDESHFLKTMKSARTKAALELTPWAQHVILLSGTPALSRPIELYPQIHAIVPTAFKHFHEFGSRYCDAKKNRFGWDYSGTSNAAELELLLRRKFMIRRMKSQVLSQLPSKVRKIVILQPRLVKDTSRQLKALALQMEKQRGMEKRGTLLQYYCLTGGAKLPAVLEYLQDKLETTNKMLIFAHHVSVMDGISEMLVDRRVDHIRIDGSTSAEARATLCERFQTEPETRVAVLSIKAANSGITLTAAQLVLFAELYWNPGELTQAEDRAHRIGQQDSVVVEYLVAKGTADDDLWALIQSKLTVLNMVGLSKDNFKNACSEHAKDKSQPTLDNFVLDTDSAVPNMYPPVDVPPSDAFTDSVLEKEFAEEAFVDDDIFDCVDLEKISESSTFDSKRQKLS